MPRIKNYHADKYAVAYIKDGEEHWAQTESNEISANRACHVLNDHEKRNNRPADRYYVVKIS